MIFPNQASAEECVEFAISEKRGDQKLAHQDLTIRVFDVQQRLWTVFFALENTPKMVGFWIHPGVGISTRLAEETLKHKDEIHEVQWDEATASEAAVTSELPVHDQLRHRILEYLSRAPLDSSRKQAESSDVYLYQTGMAAIYSLHKYLSSQFGQRSVVFSFPFHSTYHVFDDFGPGFEFFGLADKNDLDDLTSWLEIYYESGNRIQALWCEFPSNPLATTPDLRSLRQLADRYDFFLVVDETIGAFCNVDLASVADVILTSLTKSFSGYADVMGGSIVLNPSLPSYKKLKFIFNKHYQNALYHADAEVLLSNSADYLHRSAIHNRNAAALTEYFSSLANSPSSCITKVYYPTVNESRPLYEDFMRPKTDDFTPGYGALMSVEFRAVEQAAAFYDAVNVFKAPHLGAHVTLLLPYVKGLFAKELEWAAKYDMRETQIRIAPGLEDTDTLVDTIKRAVEIADKVGRKEMNGVVKGQDVVVSIT